MLSSASDQVKSFAKNFSKNSNLEDSSIPLPVFPFRRTNLKLLNIFITPKMVKKIIMNLDSSKASAPDCIPAVILKSCEPEFSSKNASNSQNIFRTFAFKKTYGYQLFTFLEMCPDLSVIIQSGNWHQ